MALSRVNRGMRRCAISLINKKGKAKIDAKNYKNCKVLGKEEFKLRYKSLTLTVCYIFYLFTSLLVEFTAIWDGNSYLNEVKSSRRKIGF